MAEPEWPRNALRVGVFEFRRSIRALWHDKSRLGFVALGVLIPVVVLISLTLVFADAIRDAEAMHVQSAVRGTIALFWLFGVYIVGQRTVSARTHVDSESLMLTTVSVRTVAVGLLVAETLRVLASVGPSAFVLTGIGVILLGSPVSLVLVPGAVLLFATTLVVTGSTLGYAAAWLVSTSRFVARHKTVLGTVASLLGVGGYFVFLSPQVSGVGPAVLSWFPMGWFVDIAIVGTRFIGSQIRAVGVVVAGIALFAAGGMIVERETADLWFTEPVDPESRRSERESETETADETPSEGGRSDALTAAVAPFVVPRVVSVPVRYVAEWALLRTRRDPNRLMFLIIPLFAVGSPLLSMGVQSGSVGELAAPLSVVVIPWLAGSLFSMNPLGDEGAVLPVTLTAVSGRQFVRGLMVPGLFVGVPLAVVVTAIAGAISPYPLSERIGLVALGVYLTCIAVTITPAIGMAFPRFSAISVGQSRDILPPRMTAIIVHAAFSILPGALLAVLAVAPSTGRTVLAGLVGVVPSLLIEWFAGADGSLLMGTAEWFMNVGNAVQALSILQVRLIGGGAVLAGGVLISILLYRNAIRRFEQYSLA